MKNIFKSFIVIILFLYFHSIAYVPLYAKTVFDELVNHNNDEYIEELKGKNQDLYPTSISLNSYIPYVGKEEVTYNDIENIKQIINILKNCTYTESGENIYGEQLGNELIITACFDNIICYDPFEENHLVAYDNVERKVCLAISNKKKCMYASFRFGDIGNLGNVDNTILLLADFFTNENIKNNFEYDLNTMEEKKQKYIEALNSSTNDESSSNSKDIDVSSSGKTEKSIFSLAIDNNLTSNSNNIKENDISNNEKNDDNTQIKDKSNSKENNRYVINNVSIKNYIIYTAISIIIFILLIILIIKIKKNK